jgi:uncharacterized protein
MCPPPADAVQEDDQPPGWRQLEPLIRADAGLMAQLQAVRRLAPVTAWVGAGAVRNAVWNALFPACVRHPPRDVDVVYFDAQRLDGAHDAALQQQLLRWLPGVPWEVMNQARVHLWFEAEFGHAVAPLRSMAEAVASWPEYATAVAVRLDEQERLHLIAPWGLDDLLQGVVRRNPTRVSVATYQHRLRSKAYAAHWPGVTVLPA